MSSGAIVAAILEKENAVEDFRNLIGATNPANAVHGSDSDDNARIEGDFFFSELERF